MSDRAPPADAPVSDGAEMPLIEHLRELRGRLGKALVAVVIAFVIGFVVRQPVFDLLIQPYCDLPAELRAGSVALDASGRCSLIFTDVLGAFFVSLKAAAVVAIVLAAPVVAYQVWRFVTPGLRPVERRYALPFVAISFILFAGGGVFAYFIIPRGLELLLGFGGENVISLMDANRYLGFIIQTMVAFGLAFEVPLILIMLALMGVVGASGLRRFRRHAVLGAFVASALITPTTDPLTMSALAAPLIAFYELAILGAWLIERRRRRRALTS